MKNNIHVIFDNEEWKIKKENSKESSKTFETKEKAIIYAKKEAEKEKVELIIHNKDGIISNKDTYGNDSYPPKG